AAVRRTAEPERGIRGKRRWWSLPREGRRTTQVRLHLRPPASKRHAPRGVGGDDRSTGKGAVVDTNPKGLNVNLDNAEWRKSTRSGPSSDNCVEVAFVAGAIAMRDSKDPAGPALVFTPAEWDAFVAGAKDGEFDLD